MWGQELKEGLRELNSHYTKLPDPVREAGVMAFASRPPVDGDLLVTRLWDLHLPNWRHVEEHPVEDMKSEEAAALEERFRRMKNAPALTDEEGVVSSEKVDMLAIQRMVRSKKGSWWQVPKDLKTPKAD